MKLKTVGDFIKYHRMKNGWSQMTLAKKLGLTEKQGRHLIKDYETRSVYPPKELSIKLAEVFKLESTYFYDDYYENSDKLPLLLKEYRESENLTKTTCANLVGTSYSMWSRWENGTPPSRSYFKKLMELHILLKEF